MLKTAHETSHKSVFDRMAGWTGWFWASSSYVLILSSCYPVILSDLSRDAPVLDSGFWVVEPPKLSDPALGTPRLRPRRPVGFAAAHG